MNSSYSKQNGAALIVALVALIILTVLGVASMSDVMNQSTTVRNEQFRQSMFYAASSELNVQINSVSNNPQSENDVIIDNLLADDVNGSDLELDITDAGVNPFLSSPDSDIVLSNATITGDMVDSAPGCDGESIGKSNVISGAINVTASSGDARDSIASVQTQRYSYCWP